MSEWLRRRALAWLGLDKAAVSIDYEPAISTLYDTLHGLIGDVKRRLATIESRFVEDDTDEENTLSQIHELQSKFDALMDMWGVTVAFSEDGPAKIVSARENGLLGDSKRYLDASRMAERFVDTIDALKDELRLPMRKTVPHRQSRGVGS